MFQSLRLSYRVRATTSQGLCMCVRTLVCFFACVLAVGNETEVNKANVCVNWIERE